MREGIVQRHAPAVKPLSAGCLTPHSFGGGEALGVRKLACAFECVSIASEKAKAAASAASADAYHTVFHDVREL